MRLRLVMTVLTILTTSCSGGSGLLEVTDSWAPTTPPNVQAAVVYLTIENDSSTDDRLLAVTSPRCGTIELHATQFDDNRIMRMRLAEPELLEIPSGDTLEMIPGGLHVMCIDLPTPFKAGEAVDLTVSLENAGDIQVTTIVENR